MHNCHFKQGNYLDIWFYSFEKNVNILKNSKEVNQNQIYKS